MGGRGSASKRESGGTGTAGGDLNVKNPQSLISLRNEGKRAEADQVLTVLRDVEQNFGVTIGDAVVAKLGRGDRSVLAAMYRGSGDLLFNQRYFDAAAATQAYDDCVKAGFHPPRGNKTAIEAIAEAYADVYCNRGRAKAGSRAIVEELRYYLQPSVRK